MSREKNKKSVGDVQTAVNLGDEPKKETAAPDASSAEKTESEKEMDEFGRLPYSIMNSVADSGDKDIEQKHGEDENKLEKIALIAGVAGAVVACACAAVVLTENMSRDKYVMPIVSAASTSESADDAQVMAEAAPEMNLQSSGSSWVMSDSHVLIQNDGAKAVVPVSAPDSFSYDGSSLDMAIGNAKYIIRMVRNDSFKGNTAYSDEQNDAGITVSAIRRVNDENVLTVVATANSTEEADKEALYGAVSGIVENASEVDGSNVVSVNGADMVMDGYGMYISGSEVSVKGENGEMTLAPTSYDPDSIGFTDKSTTAGGKVVAHGDFANADDSRAYILQGESGNVLVVTNDSDMMYTVLQIQ